MENIKILRTGINVTKIKSQLKQYADEWNTQNKIQGEIPGFSWSDFQNSKKLKQFVK